MKVATVCCLLSVTTADPSNAERQSRQMLVVPPTFYNYYNPYSVMPAVYPYPASVFPIYPGII